MSSSLFPGLRNLPGPILITGHTGFKGTWLSILLEYLNIPVVGISLLPSNDSLYTLMKRPGTIAEEFFDIRNYDKVKSVFIKYKPSVIFHLAAQPLVLESYISPLETFEINLLGTANVLDISSSINTIKSIGVITTDKVYRNNFGENKFFVETDSLEGKDPYSASKVAAEAAVTAWQQIIKKNKGQQIFSLRSGNVIGGGDRAKHRLMPDIIRSKQSGEKLVIRNPKSTRPWQHVLDPLFGYLSAAEKSLNYFISPAFNFSPNSPSLNVETVIEIANKAWGNSLNFEYLMSDIAFNYEAQELNLDSSLALKELGWLPKWSQEEAVALTINWWRGLLEKSILPSELCLADIELITRD